MITLMLSVEGNKIFFKNKMLKLTNHSFSRILKLESNVKIVRVSREYNARFGVLVVSFVAIKDPILLSLRHVIDLNTKNALEVLQSNMQA